MEMKLHYFSACILQTMLEHVQMEQLQLSVKVLCLSVYFFMIPVCYSYINSCILVQTDDSNTENITGEYKQILSEYFTNFIINIDPLLL